MKGKDIGSHSLRILRLMQYKNILSVVLQAIATIPLFMVFAGVIWQVFSRYILAVPSKYTEELIRFSLVFLTFCAGAYCFVVRRHISLDLIQTNNKGIIGNTIKIIQVIMVLIFAIFVLIYGGGKLALTQASQLSSSFNVSMFYIYGIMPIAGLIIACKSIEEISRFIWPPKLR